MARISMIPRVLARGLDALVGGFAVGEKVSEGQRWRAAGIAVTLAIPLLWKKRLGALSLAVLAALLSYYFAEEFHEREVQTTEVHTPSDPSLN